MKLRKVILLDVTTNTEVVPEGHEEKEKKEIIQIHITVEWWERNTT